MAEELVVTLSDGVRLHAEVHGDPAAPLTVVLLHGWTLNHQIWHRQLAALPDAVGAPVRIVAYDARAHGRSGASPRHASTLPRLGDDLAEVVRAVAPTGPVVLCGHSLGGMTIMEYAHRHPADFDARVAGLVFVATTAEGSAHTSYGLPPGLAAVVRTAETRSTWVLARCGEWRPHRVLSPALRPWLRWMLFGHPCDPRDLQLTISTVTATSLRAIGSFRASISQQQRLTTLGGIRPVPTRVLAGELDRLTPPKCSEGIAEALPGTHLTVLPGAGHMLMLERPDEVTAAVAEVVGAFTAAPSAPNGRHRTPRPRRPVQRIAEVIPHPAASTSPHTPTERSRSRAVAEANTVQDPTDADPQAAAS